jgi:hypothetical protein
LKQASKSALKPLCIDEIKVLPTINPSVTGEKFIPGATKLKKMLEETDELIVCPGVYDGLSARIALRVGFSALYMARTIDPPLLCSKILMP